MRRTRTPAVLSLALLAGACNGGTAPQAEEPTTTPTSPATTSTEEPPPGTERYENTEFGFTLDYPSGWAVNEEQPGAEVFIFNQESTGDGFGENLGVGVEELPGEVTLEQYTEASKRNLEAGLDEIQVTEEGPTQVGEIPAYSIEYQAEQQGQTYSFLQTWFVDGQRAFVITYTGVGEEFGTYRPEAEDVIDSFRLT
jgi:hypothetical protein